MLNTPAPPPSLIDASAFDDLTDDSCVCTDEQCHDRIIITLDQDGRLDWAYGPQECGVVIMDDDHGVSLMWRLPTNVRAGPLGVFIADHLDLLEWVHLGHTVEWDGRNYVGELDDDAQAASENFRDALNEYAEDPKHIIVSSELWAVVLANEDMRTHWTAVQQQVQAQLAEARHLADELTLAIAHLEERLAKQVRDGAVPTAEQVQAKNILDQAREAKRLLTVRADDLEQYVSGLSLELARQHAYANGSE